MNIRCIWEHNGNDSIVYSDNFPGAFTRGKDFITTASKMKNEIISYAKWSGCSLPDSFDIELVMDKPSDLQIRDADSDVLFDSEKMPLIKDEYNKLNSLALRSAECFYKLYEMIPNKNRSALPERTTFHGKVPRTAREMYEHTKSVNSYYFAQLGVDIDSDNTISNHRIRGFESLENLPGFLSSDAVIGDYGEMRSTRKALRRFIRHDQIYAKAMYKMAFLTFGDKCVPDVFGFEVKE